MKLKTFGERLNWARRNHARITQTELRNKMEELHQTKIGANYISELERETAKKRPSFEVVSAMAKVLNVSLDWLAGITEELEQSTDIYRDIQTNYMSPEADEAAQLIDEMSQEQRTIIVGIARNLISPQLERRYMRESVISMLESIERQEGVDARREMERRLREIGMRWGNLQT